MKEKWFDKLTVRVLKLAPRVLNFINFTLLSAGPTSTLKTSVLISKYPTHLHKKYLSTGGIVVQVREKDPNYYYDMAGADYWIWKAPEKNKKMGEKRACRLN